MVSDLLPEPYLYQLEANGNSINGLCDGPDKVRRDGVPQDLHYDNGNILAGGVQISQISLGDDDGCVAYLYRDASWTDRGLSEGYAPD